MIHSVDCYWWLPFLHPTLINSNANGNECETNAKECDNESIPTSFGWANIVTSSGDSTLALGLHLFPAPTV